MKVTWTVYYGGTPGTSDPGYRDACASKSEDRDGREYCFTCDPDGSRPRRIKQRWEGSGDHVPFRALATKNAEKVAPDLETAMRDYLAQNPETPEPEAKGGVPALIEKMRRDKYLDVGRELVGRFLPCCHHDPHCRFEKDNLKRFAYAIADALERARKYEI